MQILEYDDDNHPHVCLSCDAEFAVQPLNSSDMEASEPAFCPYCGSPLDDEDMDDEMLDLLGPDEDEYN